MNIRPLLAADPSSTEVQPQSSVQSSAAALANLPVIPRLPVPNFEIPNLAVPNLNSGLVPANAQGSALASSHHVVPRLGILNDYVRIPYANGSSFASQFLYREFRKRGADVTVVGPKDPKAVAEELPPSHVLFSALPFRIHPGVQLPLPNPKSLKDLASANLSLLVAQSGSALLDAGLWLRRNHNVPLVCVNTIHLPAVYDVLLPEALHKTPWIVKLFENHVIPWVERANARVYNGGDGLVVLSEGLKSYWQDRGVTVPISVIPRSVDPSVFDRRPERDPFPASARRGSRLLVLCRHTREKNIDRLLRLFATKIAPFEPDATLTLVGDGPDHDTFRELANRLGVGHRCHFPGEISLTDTPAWYRHADVFVYTSLSETYGQVVSEALWCGLPVVALADGKGVSDQVIDGSDGYLVDPKAADGDERFAAHVLGLLRDPELRAGFSERAEKKARHRSDPERCVRAYEETFAAAIAYSREFPKRQSAVTKRTPLLHWAALHLLLAVLGCLRPPGIVNRHKRPQPVWDGLELPPGALPV